MPIAPIYAYPDQLFRDTLVGIVEEILTPEIASRYPSVNGYQDAIRAVKGSVNANDRTRSLELYKAGVLRGRLIPARSGAAGTVPTGWRIAIQGECPLTHLGYATYVMGKAQSKDCANSAIGRGVSACVAVSLIVQQIELDGTSISLASAFRCLLKDWPQPATVELDAWRRFLASAMFWTLNSSTHSGRITSQLASGAPVTHLAIKPVGRPEELLGSTEFGTRIASLTSTNDMERPKDSLFWLGSSTDHRGWYSTATAFSDSLLEAAFELERTAVRSGIPNPFQADQFQDVNGVQKCAFEVIGLALGTSPSHADIWRNTMDTIEKGIRGALNCLGGSIVEEPALMFAHGVQGEVPNNEEVLIIVPLDSVDEVPEIQSRIRIDQKIFTIVSVDQTETELTLSIVPAGHEVSPASSAE